MTTDISPDMVNRQAEEITERLTRGEKPWATTSPAQRRALLARFQQLTGDNAAEWVRAAARIKRLPPEWPLVGEEWISGPWAVLTYANALGDTLGRFERGENPLTGLRSRTTASGQLAIEVLPHGVFDRKKEMIIRGGYNVCPREIEEVLYEHPAVLHAAVIGIPHPVHGEEVGAAVELRTGATATAVLAAAPGSYLTDR